MTGTGTTKTFAERLSDLMEERGVGPRAVASAVGIGHASISKYTDDNAEPGINSLVKLAEYFDVSIDYLAGRTRTRSKDPDVRAIVAKTGLCEKFILSAIENTARPVNGEDRVIDEFDESDYLDSIKEDAVDVVNYLYELDDMRALALLAAIYEYLTAGHDMKIHGNLGGGVNVFYGYGSPKKGKSKRLWEYTDAIRNTKMFQVQQLLLELINGDDEKE
jgi:transcriptional regulator with XRE-family HTH domain